MAVKIFGHSVSTPAAAAIAGGSGLAIWFAWKQHKDSAASTASSPSAIDPVTGLPYSQDNAIDPLTGQAYLAEAQEYGSVSAAESAVAGESSLDYSSAFGSGGGSSSTGVTTEVASGGYASNAAWAQAVTAGLTAIGYTSTDISGALGAYLGSLPETPAQATIVQAAIAEYGPPPVGSFTVIMATTTTTASGGSTSTGTASGTTTTTGTGSAATTTSTAPAVIKTAPTGFRVVSVTGGDNVALAWNAVPGATGYVIAYGPTSGSQEYKQGVGGGGTTSATVPGVGAGSAGKHYFELWAVPAATGGPHAGPIEATTTKS
jgi:hypothetical protein